MHLHFVELHIEFSSHFMYEMVCYLFLQPRPAVTGLELTWPPAPKLGHRLVLAATSLAPEAPVYVEQVRYHRNHCLRAGRHCMLIVLCPEPPHELFS